MLRRAHDSSGKSSLVLCVTVCTAWFIRARGAVLAVCAGAGLAIGLAGCGSGVSTVGSAPQNTAAPAASALGPQLGYLWIDADHTLRPILGTPGATRIGQSLVSAGVYINAATSASASLALLQGNDGSFDLMNLPSGAPSSLSLSLAVGAKMRLSHSAACALIWSPGGPSASLVTGLPSTPKVQSISAAGAIFDAAVSDTGTAGLEYAQGSSVAVAVVALNGRSVAVASIGSGGGLSFLPGRDDLLVADATSNTLTLIRSATNGPSTQTLASGGVLNSPVAVGVSGSGRWAMIANSGSRSAVRVDLNSGASVPVACACQPTLSEALADDGAFRLTSLSSEANWIVDAAKATPRVLFIPALPGASKSAIVASAVQP